MVRHADTEMTVMKEGIFILTNPRNGHARPHGEAPRGVRRQNKQEESVGKRLYCSFPRKKQARKGRQTEQAEDWIV